MPEARLQRTRQNYRQRIIWWWFPSVGRFWTATGDTLADYAELTRHADAVRVDSVQYIEQLAGRAHM